MGTNEIMEALKGVQMTAKNKSKLANSIMKASGGQNVVVKEPLMKYYYYKNELILDSGLLSEMLDNIVNNTHFNDLPNITVLEKWDCGDNIYWIVNPVYPSGSGAQFCTAICVCGIITLEGQVIDLPTAMVMCTAGINSPEQLTPEDKTYIEMYKAVLKPLEITEEEFFEGINTSL
jgi:hypothetical protein